MNVSEIQEALDRAHVDFDLIAHRRTETAADEARAVGVSPDEVAKTIVLASGGGFVRAVIPASKRLDLYKVRELLDDSNARLAREEEVVFAYPVYELGAVPPFGGPGGERVLVDRGLADRVFVALEAGTQRESIWLRMADLLELSHAEVADIAAEQN